MDDTNTLLTAYSRRYFIALFFLAILISSLIVVLNQQQRAQKNDAQILNRAGEQRMLSQKISMLVLEQNMLHGQSTEQATQRIKQSRDKLFAAAKRMEDNQIFLAAQIDLFDNHTMALINEQYFGRPQLNKKVADFVKAARIAASNETLTDKQVLLFESSNAEQLLQKLHHVVQLFEQGANHHLTTNKIVVVAFWGITLISLALVAVFIFRPLGFRLQSTYQRLLNERNSIAEFETAINKHSLVLQIDKQRLIIAVNKRFLKVYGYTEQEIIGQPVDIIKSTKHSDIEFYQAIEFVERGNTFRGETCSRAKNNHHYWFNTTAVPLKNDEGEIEKYFIIQNDISERKQTEQALRKIHQVTADGNTQLDDKIDQLLSLGCELFNLPFGIVSEIVGDNYRVVYAKSPNNEISSGDKFSLESTYCVHTLAANKPLSYHYTGESEIASHPCYQNFQLESYIGTPLIVDGARFGTLNFSSPDIYPHPFTDSDIELVQLLAQWISTELSRKKQREILISQRQLMEQMSELANIGAWEVDLLKERVFWSSMTKKIHEVANDYQPELATAINFYKDGRSRTKITDVVDKAIRLGQSFHEELQIITAKGNEKWIAVNGFAEVKEGVSVRLIGSFQDITERKLNESAIQEINRRMRLAADSAGIGVWDLNVKTGELDWDEQMFKIYGIAENDFSDAYEVWENGLHPDDKQASVQTLQNAIAQGEKFVTQFRVVLSNGEIRHIAGYAVPRFDDNNHVSRMVGVNYDVTDRVENELALTQAKIAAESAAKVKSEFLASMSHEIRTPMNAVLGMLELLQDTELTKEQTHRVSIAQSSAKSLLNLINDILDFSKIDADKLDLEFIPFDLRKMAGELAQSLATQAEAKGLELVLDTVGVCEPQVVGDPSRIRQILTNLASNAIKFTHQGEVVIRAELGEEDCEYWRLTLTVKDTGIGVPEDKQDKLFDSFSQVDSSTTRHYGGTGLGLAIVKKLCQRMDGDVQLHSQVGKGSEFVCNIRVGKTMQINHIMPSVDVSELAILVVDDNATNREVISRQLAKWGASVVNAGSGQDAIDICQQRINRHEKVFDIGILDMQMPVMDGAMLASELRKLDALAPMKFIMMTSMQSPGDGKFFANLGFSGYFPKPATTSDLFAAVNIIADGGEALRQANPLVTQHYIKEIVEHASLLDEDDDSHQQRTELRVLLVEDNRVNQMVAKGVLNKIGYQCDVAENGIDAIEKLKSADFRYDLALMDVQMPEMDGYEATKRIRQGEAGKQHQQMKIIAMTANAMAGDREKCIAAGMDDYLSKPIDKDKLEDKIKRQFSV